VLFLTCISVWSESSLSFFFFLPFLSPHSHHNTHTKTIYKEQHSNLISSNQIKSHAPLILRCSTHGRCSFPQTITAPTTTLLLAPPPPSHSPPAHPRHPRFPPPMARRRHRPPHPLVTRSAPVPRHVLRRFHSLSPRLRLRQPPLPISPPLFPLLPRLELRLLFPPLAQGPLPTHKPFLLPLPSSSSFIYVGFLIFFSCLDCFLFWNSFRYVSPPAPPRGWSRRCRGSSTTRSSESPASSSSWKGRLRRLMSLGF